MNAYLPFDGNELWQNAGWTMIHFLWLGTLVGLIAVIARVVLGRATPNLRYAAALGCFATLAVLPVGIAAWLAGSETPSLTKVPAPHFQAVDSRLPAVNPIDDTSVAADDVIELAPVDGGGQVTASAVAGIQSQPSASSISQSSEPSPSPSLRGRGISVAGLKAYVPYLPWLWLVGTPITFVLLAAGIVGTKRLRHASRVIDDGPIAELMSRLVSSLRVGRRVTVAVCDRISAPVLVGIVRPLVLLPPAALTGWSPDEIEMVLLHELAHVRRWDNLVNLLQRFIESLLFFHPVVWLVSNWVRREREACCDAAVVARTNRPHAYAEMLVALAAQMPRSVLFHPAASSAMAAGPLRARIRRILGLEDDPMLISGKSLALMLATLLVSAALAVLYLPRIGQADQPAEKTSRAPKAIQSPTTDARNYAELFNINPAEELSANDAASMAALFGVDPTNPTETRKYRVSKKEQKSLEVTLNSFKTGPLSKHIRFKDHWDDQSNTIEITAPKLALDGFFDPIIHSLGKWDEIKSAQAAAAKATDRTTGGKFPSLEDQKLADLAYKRLGLEMESIGEGDLKRVKALGYDGGLKVTSGSGGIQGRAENIEPEDILVGLHVWPTTSMKALAEVLQRDDLAELNPLKFYVVRQYWSPGPEGEPPRPSGDSVLTGRVTVQLGGGFDGVALAADIAKLKAGRAATRSQIPGAAPKTAATPSAPHTRTNQQDSHQSAKESLRYEGKSFEEWRTAWQTELSTEKRVAAVNALAAFGAAGYGEEAAKAILDIVDQYDWSTIDGKESVTGRLQIAAFDALGGVDFWGRQHAVPFQSIPSKHWLPILLERLPNHENIQQFSQYMLPSVGPDASFAADELIALSRDGPAPVRTPALQALNQIDPKHENERINSRWRELLGSKNPDDIGAALWASATVAKAFNLDLIPLLLHENDAVQRAARGTLRFIEPSQRDEIFKALVAIVEDPKRSNDHVATIRAIGGLGGGSGGFGGGGFFGGGGGGFGGGGSKSDWNNSAEAAAWLENIMMDRKKPVELRAAAMNALQRITKTDNESRLRQSIMDENKDMQDTAEYRSMQEKLEQAIQAENNLGI